MKIQKLIIGCITVIFSLSLSAQDVNIFIPRDIQAAYDSGYRSYDGRPGPEYFQNRANYEINVELDPFTRHLKGSERIEYINNSPFLFKYVVISLYHDIFEQGAIRAEEVDPEDIGEGIQITRLRINGNDLDPEDASMKFYETTTNKVYPLFSPSVKTSIIEIEWEVILPGKTHERFGPVDESSAFVGYWFPQVAVFDDINNWDLLDYNNLSETYNQFGDFDVRITAPENYVIWATGSLQNPKEVLDNEIFNRYEKALRSKDKVKIIEKSDYRKGKIITAEGNNTWHFVAENVNDFAFGYSDHYLWDGILVTPDIGEDVFVESAYLPESRNFQDVAEISAWVVKELAENATGLGFPFPKICVFNGMDGMEYPMIVNDREENEEGTWFLTTHEITHTYFPFMVGINQRRYGFMDEGLVTMLGTDLHLQKIDAINFRRIYLDWYPRIAGTQEDVPLLVNSAYISGELFQLHEYVRPSLAFWILKDILGEEMFKKCLQEFIRRWQWKHPTPYDLFFTFNDVTGENLNWFFQPWFIDFAYPDLGIQSLEPTENGFRAVIKNYGGMPFPSRLEIIYNDGTSEWKDLEAKFWSGTDILIYQLDKSKIPQQIILHTENYPDVNLVNNRLDFVVP